MFLLFAVASAVAVAAVVIVDPGDYVHFVGIVTLAVFPSYIIAAYFVCLARIPPLLHIRHPSIYHFDLCVFVLLQTKGERFRLGAAAGRDAGIAIGPRTGNSPTQGSCQTARGLQVLCLFNIEDGSYPPKTAGTCAYFGHAIN